MVSVFPARGGPATIDVVFQVLDPQAELQGVHRPVLGHHLFLQGGEIQGGFKTQAVGVARGSQTFRLQFPAIR